MNIFIVNPRIFIMSIVLAASACSSAPVEDGDDESSASSEDDLRALQSAEIVGELAYGESANVSYTYGPLYRAYRFYGAEGDIVSAHVHSANGGEPYVWIVDARAKTLASAGTMGQREATVGYTLEHDGSYYVVLRNRRHAAASFALTLEGEAASSGVPTELSANEISERGTVLYGEQLSHIDYTDGDANYAGVSFRAIEGDRLDIDVTGTEPVALLVDASGKVLASNQSQEAKAKIRARAPKTGMYTIAFRHMYYENNSYAVSLNRAGATEGVDPFDPTSCSGLALTNADVAMRLPSLAAKPGETFVLGNHTLMTRTRTCSNGGCSAWSPPRKAQIGSSTNFDVAELAPVKLVRQQSGSVNLSFTQPGCYSLPIGTTCQIDPTGNVSCEVYEASYKTKPRTRHDEARCEEYPVGVGQNGVRLSGTIRQHCARVSQVLRSGNTETEFAAITQF